MLKLKDINEEIEELEAAEKLNANVCQQLAWLYTIRDHHPDFMSGKYGMESKSKSSMPDEIDLHVYSQSDEDSHVLNRASAVDWVSNMENADGTTGAHWNMDQAKQIMEKYGIEASPLAWWVTLNMMYSDYCGVAKKLGMSTDFYAYMAEAFLDDKDAVGGGGSEKLASYHEYVSK